MDLAPLLAFNGDFRAAITFHAALLYRWVTVVIGFGRNEGHAVPSASKEWTKEYICYGAVQFGEYALPRSDIIGDDHEPMRDFNIMLHLEDAGEARHIFAALADGGDTAKPLSRPIGQSRSAWCVIGASAGG